MTDIITDLRRELFNISQHLGDQGLTEVQDALCLLKQLARQRLDTGAKLVEHANALVAAQQRIQVLEAQIEQTKTMVGGDHFDSALAAQIVDGFSNMDQKLEAISGGVARLGVVVEGGDE